MVDALPAVEGRAEADRRHRAAGDLAAGSVVDASCSVAGCNTGAATPVPLAIASFAWSAVPAGIIVSGAATSKVTIDPSPGTLTLTVTDSAGNSDTETVTLDGERRDQLGAVELRRPEQRLSRAARGDAAAAAR